MKKILVSLFVGLMGFAQIASAAPAEVIIIRHGEKPPAGNELNERGQERAKALVNFFETNPAVTRYGTPTAIYAMAPDETDGSVRAIQTVTPLAESLGLTIHENFTKDQLKELVTDIMSNPDNDGKMVLICWEHHVIPTLVEDFGWGSAPQNWKNNIFDRAWILDFTGDQVTSFKNMPEHVLPGDSSNECE